MLTIIEKNERESRDYWNKRVIEAEGNPLKAVFNSNVRYAKSQKIGEALIEQFVPFGSMVLDVGCGFGRYYEAFKKLNCDYLGVDFSEEMIKEAQKLHPEAQFKVADWQDFLGKYPVVFESTCLSSSGMTMKQFRDFLLNRYVHDDGRLIMVEEYECLVTINKSGSLFL